MALLNDRESRKLHDIEKEDNDSCSVGLPSENDGGPKTRDFCPVTIFLFIDTLQYLTTLCQLYQQMGWDDLNRMGK